MYRQGIALTRRAYLAQFPRITFSRDLFPESLVVVIQQGARLSVIHGSLPTDIYDVTAFRPGPFEGSPFWPTAPHRASFLQTTSWALQLGDAPHSRRGSEAHNEFSPKADSSLVT
jgi:hypothetical protein